MGPDDAARLPAAEALHCPLGPAGRPAVPHRLPHRPPPAAAQDRRS